MSLSSLAKQRLSQFESRVKNKYKVDDLSTGFSAPTPQIEQNLVNLVNAPVDILSAINTHLVTNKSGQTIGNIGSPISKRTNTDVKDRQATRLGNLDANGYETVSHEDDHAIKYETLNEWAYLNNFEQLLLNESRRGISESRVKIMWNGTSVAAETDPVANPLGEDVNKGFLQYLREFNGGSNALSALNVANQINIGGPQGDVASVDELVFLLLQVIPTHLRSNLVVFVGEDLLTYETTKLLSAVSLTPTEKSALLNGATTRQYGTLSTPPASFMSFFPSRGVFITPINNLSMYIQRNTVTQQFVNEVKRNQYSYFNTANIGFALEDPRRSALAEPSNIKIYNPVTETYQ